MADNKINIQPKEIAVINTITKITIQITNIIINKSVVLLVSFYDDKDKYISTLNLNLEGEDYSNWGNDDNYLINYVSNKLNIQPIPEPEPEPLIEIPTELQ